MASAYEKTRAAVRAMPYSEFRAFFYSSNENANFVVREIERRIFMLTGKHMSLNIPSPQDSAQPGDKYNIPFLAGRKSLVKYILNMPHIKSYCLCLGLQEEDIDDLEERLHIFDVSYNFV